MRRLLALAMAVTGLLCLRSASAVADGTSGSLDLTFAERGITWLTQTASAVAIQPDGKIIVGGIGANRNGRNGFALTRYNPDGTLDASFSGNGKVRTLFPNGGAVLSIAIQADGRIVVGGNAFTRDQAAIAVTRYLPDGSLDPSFSRNGKFVAVKVGSIALSDVSDIALDSSGRIVATAYIHGGNHILFGVVRFTRRGEPDRTFSVDGVAVSRFGRHPGSFAEAIALQPDGSIVAAGSVRTASGYPGAGFAVARYLPDGTLDDSFNDDGKRLIRFDGTWAAASDVEIQEDGRIVIAGTVHLGPRSRYGQLGIVVARCLTGGALDPSFAGDGKRTTTLDGNLRGSALEVQSDGKIVIGGEATPTLDEYPTNMAIVRYTTHGTLDASFAGDGIRVAGFRLDDWIEDIALQADGKIVAVGASQGGPPRGYAVARFLP